MCLRWFVSYRRHTIVPLETRSIRLKVSALLFLLASQRISGTPVCDRLNICLLRRSSAIRPSQTATDRHRPLQIIWKPGFTKITTEQRASCSPLSCSLLARLQRMSHPIGSSSVTSHCHDSKIFGSPLVCHHHQERFPDCETLSLWPLKPSVYSLLQKCAFRRWC